MHAYRTPAVVDPDPLPNACVPDAAAPAPPWRHLTPALVKALGVATTLFLLTGSASLGAIAWSLVTAPAHDAAPERPPQVQAAAPAALACASRPAPAPAPLASSPPFYAHAPGESALSLSGPQGTNDVDELWSRARRIGASTHRLRLSRSVIPLRALSSAALASDLHVVPWAGPGAPGLRVTALDARSPAARAGLRRGDVIAGINGVALLTPDRVREAWEATASARAAVLEIVRAGGPLVLRVDFRP